MKLGENNILIGNGFRSNRRGTDNLFMVNEITEYAKDNNKTMFMVFLNIEKAYDRFNKELMRGMLESKIVNAIKRLYVNTRMEIKLGNIESY